MRVAGNQWRAKGGSLELRSAAVLPVGRWCFLAVTHAAPKMMGGGGYGTQLGRYRRI